MTKYERQKRYKASGGAAGLIKVEVLVPPDGREHIVTLARNLRQSYRQENSSVTMRGSLGPEAGFRNGARHVDVDAVLSKIRNLCAAQPRRPIRHLRPVDIDKLVTTSINVPFQTAIDAETLADAIRENVVPEGFSGHLGRFLGELPLREILGFCDHHGLAATDLARFVRKNRDRLAVHRPELEEALNDVVSGS